jgi:hypothetical protein
VQALKVDQRHVTLGGVNLSGALDEEKRLHKLIWVGIADESSLDKHWDSSVRAMRHTSAIADQLLTMLKDERAKVGWVFLLERKHANPFNSVNS